jgi:hypothetical protein
MSSFDIFFGAALKAHKKFFAMPPLPTRKAFNSPKSTVLFKNENSSWFG